MDEALSESAVGAPYSNDVAPDGIGFCLGQFQFYKDFTPAVLLFSFDVICVAEKTRRRAVRAPIFSGCTWLICGCGIFAITPGWTRISRPASTCFWATTRRARRTSSKRFISWPRCGRSAASAARRWSGTARRAIPPAERWWAGQPHCRRFHPPHKGTCGLGATRQKTGWKRFRRDWSG